MWCLQSICAAQEYQLDEVEQFHFLSVFRVNEADFIPILDYTLFCELFDAQFFFHCAILPPPGTKSPRKLNR